MSVGQNPQGYTHRDLLPKVRLKVILKQIYNLLCKENKYMQDFDYIILSSSVKDRKHLNTVL